MERSHDCSFVFHDHLYFVLHTCIDQRCLKPKDNLKLKCCIEIPMHCCIVFFPDVCKTVFLFISTACRKGTWGADCSQDCPPTESDCDRFRGPIPDETMNKLQQRLLHWCSGSCNFTLLKVIVTLTEVVVLGSF